MTIALHSVRTRLLGAFGLVAGMTLLAALVAFIAFGSVKGAFSEVVDGALPRVEAAETLNAASGAITGELAAFARARDTIDQTASETRLTRLTEDARASIAALRAAGVSSTAVGELTAAVDDLAAAVDDAEAAGRMKLAAQDSRVSNLRGALSERARAASALEAQLDEADDPAQIETILRLIMGVNLVATQYAELESAETASQVDAIEERFEYAADELLVNVAIMGDALDADTGSTIEALTERAFGATGVFQNRRSEIAVIEEADLAVEEARFAHAALAQQVDSLLRGANASVEDASAAGVLAVNSGRTILALITLAALAASAAVGWLYVNNNLLARLSRMAKVMTDLAAGDTRSTIEVKGRDELTDMARAVAVFRDNAVERERLEQEQAAERQAREQRAKAIETLIRAFEEASDRALTAVSSAADQLDMAADALNHSSATATERTADVNQSGETAAQNVDTVAAAAEEMTSSISEIAQQIERSNAIARDAAARVEQANDDVGTLTEAAGRIDGVVRLINDIAEQTNLLALNATIEAARAGEAGKGFAVVASEVKQLASQTAKATGSISEQVQGIQGATGKAVSAMQSIGQVISEMNEISTAIAAAMEEQRAAAGEITRSAQEAASGARNVSQAIGDVNRAASETGQCAAQVSEASSSLNTEADSLRKAVTGFLSDVRAA